MIRLILTAVLLSGCVAQPTEYQYSPFVYKICQTSNPANAYRCMQAAPRPNPRHVVDLYAPYPWTQELPYGTNGN